MSSVPGPVLRAIESLHLPAMPQILLRFVDEAGSDSVSADGLAELVLRDPALSARVLTVANSAAFRRSGELRSVKQSLMVLGTRMVRTIASCLLVQTAFQRVPGSQASELAGFWRHSLLVAELARGTAVELGASESEGEEAYLAGLLHDVGQLLLLGGLGDAYGALLARSEGESELAGMERAVFATDHAAVAAWLVDQWALPSLMADAILFHHLEAGKVGGLDRLGRILWSAHAASLPPQAATLADLSVIEGLLGIAPERFGVLRDEAAQRVEALAAALDVAVAPPTQTVPMRAGRRGGGADAKAPAGADEAGLQAAASTMAALQPLPRDMLTLDSEVDLLLCVRESARILFGIQRMAFFLARPREATLRAIGLGGLPGPLQRLAVALQPGASLCADAALERRTLSTFDLDAAQPLAPADRQIARALDAEGLLYVPLLAHGALLGVMAFAVSTVQRTRLVERAPWLRNFAGVVAANLSTWRQVREREEQIEAEVSGRYLSQGRRIVHEVNNPLAIIRNYLSLISKESAGSRSQADVDVVREEIDRLSGIVRQLAAEASSAPAPDGMIDLNRMFEGLRTLYQDSLFGAAGVALDLDLPREAAFAFADRDPLKQVVFNLWKNAAEALRPGDVVTTDVTPHVNQNGKTFVQIRIRDTGPGLPAAVLESLYLPLAPGPDGPHAPGRAGLGLSIVLALVERLRGTITCHTREGGGTTFTLLIPESQRAAG